MKNQQDEGGFGTWVSTSNFLKREITRTANRGPRPDEVLKVKRMAAEEERKREISAAYREYDKQLRNDFIPAVGEA